MTKYALGRSLGRCLWKPCYLYPANVAVSVKLISCFGPKIHSQLCTFKTEATHVPKYWRWTLIKASVRWMSFYVLRVSRWLRPLPRRKFIQITFHVMECPTWRLKFHFGGLLWCHESSAMPYHETLGIASDRLYPPSKGKKRSFCNLAVVLQNCILATIRWHHFLHMDGSVEFCKFKGCFVANASFRAISVVQIHPLNVACLKVAVQDVTHQPFCCKTFSSVWTLN